MIDIPFLYTTTYAFKLLLMYDDKKSIKLKNLFLYRESVLERVLEAYSEEDNEYYAKDDRWVGDIEFKEIDDEKELNKLLKDYPDIFYVKEDKIYLREGINLDYINTLLESFHIAPLRFFEANHSRSIHEILGIKKIYQFKNNIEKIGHALEQQIEQAYMNNSNLEIIKKLLFKRQAFLMSIFLNNENFIKRYFSLPEEEEEDEYNKENEEYDYLEQSRYSINEEEYPIDSDLYENSDYFEDYLNDLEAIHDNLEDNIQYAIFGNGNLYLDKFNNYFTEFSYDAIASTVKDKNPLHFDSEFAFFIVYIQKLNELIDNGKPNLNKVKNRILYLLDDCRNLLYLPEKFKIFYEKACEFKNIPKSFAMFEDEAKYFIIDLFEGEADKKDEKMLFIATYYELTEDQEIIDILSKYKNLSNYKTIYEIIVGENRGYTKQKNL